MTTPQANPVRKRPVNLSLNEDVVAQAKALTPNLSSVVDALLSGYVAQKQHERLNKQEHAKLIAGIWNGFNEQCGSFADEYSSL